MGYMAVSLIKNRPLMSLTTENRTWKSWSVVDALAPA